MFLTIFHYFMNIRIWFSRQDYNQRNYDCSLYYVSLIISLNDGPASPCRVTSVRLRSVSSGGETCVSLTSSCPMFPAWSRLQTVWVLPHTEVHSSGVRVPARHYLQAVSHPVSGGEPSPPLDLATQCDGPDWGPTECQPVDEGWNYSSWVNWPWLHSMHNI